MLIPALPSHLYPLNVGGKPSFTPLPVRDNLLYLQLSSWIISCITHSAAKSYSRYKRPMFSVTVQLLTLISIRLQSTQTEMMTSGNLDLLDTFVQIYFAIRKNTFCNLNKCILFDLNPALLWDKDMKTSGNLDLLCAFVSASQKRLWRQIWIWWSIPGAEMQSEILFQMDHCPAMFDNCHRYQYDGPS